MKGPGMADFSFAYVGVSTISLESSLRKAKIQTNGYSQDPIELCCECEENFCAEGHGSFRLG